MLQTTAHLDVSTRKMNQTPSCFGLRPSTQTHASGFVCHFRASPVGAASAGDQTFFVCGCWLGSSACASAAAAVPAVPQVATSLSPVELPASSTDPRRALKEYKVGWALLLPQCVAHGPGWS